MIDLYFPECPFTGPVDPVPFAHFGFTGSIPRKCADCDFLLEGDCLRTSVMGRGYQVCDAGPCPIEGPAHAVEIDTPWKGRLLRVPSKCASCEYLDFTDIRGAVCRLDERIWGSFPRSLDWGDWEPA